MDDIATTPINGHAARAWPERTCAKCKEKFTPLTARERRCVTCAASADGPGGKPVARPAPSTATATAPKRRGRPPAKKLARGRRGNGLADEAQPNTPMPAEERAWQPKPLSATSRSGVLKPSQIATATELLELAGYKVVAVHTPAGEFLRVLE